MEYLFLSLVLTSFIGTALSLILTALRPVTRKVFSATWHYYIWLCVLFVMIAPIKLDIPQKAVEKAAVSVSGTVAVTHGTALESTQISVPFTAPDITSEPQSNPRFPVDTVSVVSHVWLIGAIMLFLIKTISYAVFLYQLRRHTLPGECPELSAFTNRKVRIRVGNKICSPLMTGIIKPTLILPEAELSAEQLKYILAHETTHLKRNDILYKWFLTIVKCIHWFNPCIYFISRQIGTDCEVSCDITVINRLDKKQERRYIETILSLLSENNSRSVPLTTGMTGNKKTIKRRFVMIKNKVKMGKKAVVLSVVSAVVIVVISLFSSGIISNTASKYFPAFTSTPATDKASGTDFNLLFVGVDNQNHSDSIMVIKVRENSINGVSVPRNTLIDGKIIADIWASDNGSQILLDSIKQKLNLPIHYYAQANLNCVAEIIDTLGGIEYSVPMDMVYEDPYQDLKINLKEGHYTLTGEAVCQLLRYRPGRSTQGDLSRIYNAEQFLEQFVRKMLTAENMSKIPELYKIAEKNIKTNLSPEKLKSCTYLLSAARSNNIHFETVYGSAATYNGIPVYELSDELTFVWPTESVKISNGFGKRVHPITGEERTHNGVDIIAPEGSAVISAVGGTVTDTGYDSRYGNYIVTESADGVKVFYGHLASILVSKGDRVEQSHIIGSVGRTGNATGAHLHFEIQVNGQYYNPEKSLTDYNTYHDNIDSTIPSSVVTAFFKAFEKGDYTTMKKYCTEACINTHFMENDYGSVFNVFGMSMATLRSISEPDYLKGDLFMGYTVNVSCKTPASFSILKSKNTFRVFVEKLEDETYKIYDLSY